MLEVPTPEQKKNIIKNVNQDLQSYHVESRHDGTLHRVVCCVCDLIPPTPQWWSCIEFDELKALCRTNNLSSRFLKPFYPEELIKQYKLNHVGFDKYVLSP